MYIWMVTENSNSGNFSSYFIFSFLSICNTFFFLSATFCFFFFFLQSAIFFLCSSTFFFFCYLQLFFFLYLDSSNFSKLLWLLNFQIWVMYDKITPKQKKFYTILDQTLKVEKCAYEPDEFLEKFPATFNTKFNQIASILTENCSILHEISI